MQIRYNRYFVTHRAGLAFLLCSIGALSIILGYYNLTYMCVAGLFLTTKMEKAKI